MFMFVMFFLFSFSVFAYDTDEEIRKIHGILKEQQSQILQLQNENKLLKKNVEILNEIITTVEQTSLAPEESKRKTVLQKRVEHPKQSINNKGTCMLTLFIISFLLFLSLLKLFEKTKCANSCQRTMYVNIKHKNSKDRIIIVMSYIHLKGVALNIHVTTLSV